MNEDQIAEIQSLPAEEEVVKLPDEISNLIEALDTLKDNGGLPLVEPTEVKVQEQHNPEDVAAAFFGMQKAKYQTLLAKMAPYQLRRAIMNAVSYPFVDKEYLPETDEEKQFAYLTGELMLNKTIMQLSFEMQQAEKASSQQTEEVVKDTTDEIPT